MTFDDYINHNYLCFINIYIIKREVDNFRWAISIREGPRETRLSIDK